MLIFSGRRWVVQEIHNNERIVLVVPAKAGVPRNLTRGGGGVHDRVVERMFALFEGTNRPAYMDKTALTLLEEARVNYRVLAVATHPLIRLSDTACVAATRCGTVKTATLALVLGQHGFLVQPYDGFLEITGSDTTPPLPQILERLARGEGGDLFVGDASLAVEKFHEYLTTDLLRIDALSSRLDPACLPDVCSRLLRVDGRAG